MRNIDEFVRKGCIWPDTFKGQREHYERLETELETLENKKKAYDDLLKRDYFDDSEFGFREKRELYVLLSNLISISSNATGYYGINLVDLRRKLVDSFDDVSKYNDLLSEQRSTRQGMDEVLTDGISFSCMGDYSKFSERCFMHHYLVRFADELVCMCCGATTKEFDMSKEDLEFLTLCAERQGILLKEVKEEDIPLLKVLFAERDYYKSQRKAVDGLSEGEDFELSMEYLLSDEEEILDIRREIKKAHKLDSRDLEGLPKVGDPKYLSDEKVRQLLSLIDEQVANVEQSNSRFKKLLLEECKAARYEVLILSGVHIPTLLLYATDEDEKIALVKAYYNLTCQSFRINSGYFKSDNNNWDAIAYDCRTANSEINQKILELKR